MLEEAINVIEKERDMYIIQEKNISSYARRKVEENKLKEKIRREIQVRDYILSILEKQKKEGKKNVN